MQAEEVIKNEISEEAIEKKLKKKFKVSQIRMPDSEILASEIEEKLDLAAELFAHIICAWNNKGLYQSANAINALLELVSIHPTLIYAALISKGKYWNDMDMFNLDRYDSGHKDFQGISHVAQIFFILAMCDCRNNLEILQDWINDHVIQKSYLRESYLGDSTPNLDGENLIKFKSFIENIIKPFPDENNILIELVRENKVETVSYLFNLCDLYMTVVGSERKIRDELLQVKGTGEGTAWDEAVAFGKLEMAEVLITQGGFDINKLDEVSAEMYHEMKVKKDAEKKTEAFLKRREDLRTKDENSGIFEKPEKRFECDSSEEEKFSDDKKDKDEDNFDMKSSSSNKLEN